MHDAILLVDDDPLLCRELAASLQRQGFRVRTAGDAAQGLALARRQRPDLVLLDIMMPDTDGYQVCVRLRELSDVPIILLTALGQPDSVVQGLASGADDYIGKPFHLTVLQARIEAVLRRAEKARRLSWGPLAAAAA